MMKLSEIQSLISIRDYINLAINNFNRPKNEVSDLRSMIVLVDNKIISMLLAEDFKEYVNFSDAKKAMVVAAELNNIKSGIQGR